MTCESMVRSSRSEVQDDKPVLSHVSGVSFMIVTYDNGKMPRSPSNSPKHVTLKGTVNEC